MKWKQILLVMGISALTSVSSVWLYGKYANSRATAFTQSTDGKTPANYAGFFNAAPGTEVTDFTKACKLLYQL